MITETLLEQNTTPDVVSNQEDELNKMPSAEENNLQQKNLEQINDENDTLLENPSDKTKSQTINVASTSQEKTIIVSESAIQPTLSSNMGPVELFKYFASSTPRMLFALYLLILFTWSYLQRSPLLLLSLGMVFGYLVRANTVTNEVKEKIVMIKDTKNLSSVEVGFGFKKIYYLYIYIHLMFKKNLKGLEISGKSKIDGTCNHTKN